MTAASSSTPWPRWRPKTRAGRQDIYEWVGGRTSLISSGIGRFDSELLSTTRDGIDAFFFTHDALDSNLDENGERTKIYDARTDGGFFKLPVEAPVRRLGRVPRARDRASRPAADRELRQDQQGNHLKGCPKGKVKRKGKCVKKKPKKGAKKTKKRRNRNG